MQMSGFSRQTVTVIGPSTSVDSLVLAQAGEEFIREGYLISELSSEGKHDRMPCTYRRNSSY